MDKCNNNTKSAKAQPGPLGSNYQQRVPEQEYRQKMARIERYAMQSLARELLPDERVSWCLRRVQTGKTHVEIHTNSDNDKCHYRNLIRCGSVWHCPICASRITEYRRKQLSYVIEQHTGHLYMVTFTLSHGKRDDLSPMLEDLREAMRKFKSGRWWKDQKAESGIVGTVQTLEITWGANGWHPHLHMLLFTEQNDTPAAIQKDWGERWIRVLDKVGRTAKLNIGVDVKRADIGAGDYLIKWGAAEEITKSQVKKARSDGGKTPYQLLKDYGNGDKYAGKLYQEYAIVLKGHYHITGLSQLVKALGIVDPPDVEAVELAEEVDTLLCRLSWDAWKVILKKDKRAETLEYASHGLGTLIDYLRSIGVEVNSLMYS